MVVNLLNQIVITAEIYRKLLTRKKRKRRTKSNDQIVYINNNYDQKFRGRSEVSNLMNKDYCHIGPYFVKNIVKHLFSNALYWFHYYIYR